GTWREVGPRLLVPAAALVAPLLLWRVALPYAVLSDVEWRRFADAARSRSALESDLAFGSLTAAAGSLLHDDAVAADTLAGIQSRLEALAAFHGGTVAAWSLVLAALAATTWCLRSRRREDHAAGWIGLFGLATVLWWLAANRLGWYRHVLPADLAFAVVIVHAVLGVTRPASRGRAVRLVAALALYAAAVVGLAGTGVTRLDRHGAALAALAEEKAALLSLAALVRERLDDHAAFYAVQWYQAPQIQLLSRNVFRDVFAVDDVAADLAAGRTPYLVATPETLAFEHGGGASLDFLRATARRTVFDRAGYQLLELDPDALQRMVDAGRVTSRGG
ncbi:MAG: hypothetical protein AB1689_29540, partial [Thermodesulfobacteriota bacterium]